MTTVAQARKNLIHAATQAGRPLPRLERPLYEVDALDLLCLTIGRRGVPLVDGVRLDEAADAVHEALFPTPGTDRRGKTVYYDPQARLLAPSTTEIKLAARWAEDHAERDEDGRDGSLGMLGRAMSASLGIEHPQLIVPVVQALSRNFWVPEGTSLRTLDSWSHALGTSGRSPERQMSAAFAALGRTASGGASEPHKALFKQDCYVLGGARYPGAVSSMRAFQAMSRGRAVVADAILADVAMRPLHLAAGTVNQAHAATDSRLIVTPPTRLRVGKRILVQPAQGDKIARFTVQAVSFDRYRGVFDLTIEAERTRDRAALSAGDGVFVREAPFMGGAPNTSLDRWVSRQAEHQVKERAMPLDILLAGDQS